MEPGHSAGTAGLGERLTPAASLTPGLSDSSTPKDIILDSSSDIGATLGAAARFDANLQAVRLVKQLEAEQRQATPTEQATIARFSGWGDSAFNEAFNRYTREEAWKRRGENLKLLVSPEEYQAIERSRLNAFFTTPAIIQAMWRGLRKMGADDLAHPRILEPSAGSGRFLGFQPADVAARSERTAVELDRITGQMLKQTYPRTAVYVMGFEQAPIPKDSIDIAISNVPFGDFPIHDPTFKKERRLLTRQIHNYFFAKALEVLRPGGMLAFVTSHGTLDAPGSRRVREMLAEQADLVAAVRLPKGAFPDTEVVTDIVYMRKRLPHEPLGDTSWVDSHQVDIPGGSGSYRYNVPVNINQYFLDHPEMVLGTHSASGTMYRGGEYSVEPREDLPVDKGLDIAWQRLPYDIVKEAPKSTPTRAYNLPSALNVREGTRVINQEGVVFVKHQGNMEKASLSEAEQVRVKDMLAIRDSSRKVIDLQLANAEDETFTAAQKALNELYDRFVLAHGALSAKQNAELLTGDPDGPFLRSLEKAELGKMAKGRTVTPDQLAAIKMPLFSKRTVHGMTQRKVESEADALAVSLNETGRLDFARMGELLGQDAESVRSTLAHTGRIFKNPMGDWEPAEKYLTGDVREKLRVAEAASSAHPEYHANVEALKVVQPEDLGPSQIAVRLGAPWIPSEVVNDFTTNLLSTQRYGYRRELETYFKYEPETGKWLRPTKIIGDSAKMTSEWGTPRMPAGEIIEHVLNGTLVEVKDKGDDDKPVRNAQETIAAQEKAAAIETAFRDWLWKDPDRARELVDRYNDTFNNYRPPRFDGGHQELPGMALHWHKQIHPHQKDAIWRTVQDRTALLAHEVGFGKTAVMVGAGMELRRLGLAQKNLYVVPKATHQQFYDQFRDVYPHANILFPSEDDFTTGKRAEFVSRAVTGDWDAIILSDTQFRRVPLKPETQLKFLQEEVGSLRAALDIEAEAARKVGSRTKSASHKEIQKTLIRVEGRLLETQAKVGEVTDKTTFFENMGVDQLFVDEADMFKNLRFVTRMGRLKGLPNSDSERAWDMYQKLRYLQEQGQKAGVVFATGTPIANTIAEMYTMQRYLQPQVLEAKGLQHFDGWAKTFGQTTESLEQTTTGAYKVTQRFAKFANAPELSNMWQQVADIRVADEVPGIVRLRPRLVDDKGRPRRTVISVPPTDALISYMRTLSDRAENLGNVDPHDDNMLKIANDARMASLDMRMVDPQASPNPEGKIAIAARNITRIHQETAADKGTQLVFLDIGTPKVKEGDDEGQGPALEETAEETARLKDVYSALRQNLIASGIPESDIAFIHDAKNDRQRADLFRKVNKGEIRVLIGSTGKLGTGVNVQARAAALHHIDAPWRPRDIEQREGRVIRQGNIVYGPKRDATGNILDPGPGVRVYTYVTERSFDAYMWQAIEAKSKAIKAMMRREKPPREIEDVDSLTMSAGEAKAVASGNPDVLKAAMMKNNVNRLQMLQASYIDAMMRAREQTRTLPAQITTLQQSAEWLGKDQKHGEPPESFALMVNGRTFAERSEASETLKAAIQGAPLSTEAQPTVEIGRYRGLALKVQNTGPAGGYILSAVSPDTGRAYALKTIAYSELPSTNVIQRFDNRLGTIGTELEHTKREIERSKSSLKTYEERIQQPFEHEERLKVTQAELLRLERKLQGEQVEGPSDNYVPLEEDLLEGEQKGYRYGEATEAQKAAMEPTPLAPIPSPIVEVSPMEVPVAPVAPAEAVARPEAVAPAVREPWQMTKQQYIASDSATGRFRAQVEATTGEARERASKQWDIAFGDAEGTHKAAVSDAVRSGKPVPPEVLADYPDLAAKAKVPRVPPFAGREVAPEPLLPVAETARPIPTVTGVVSPPAVPPPARPLAVAPGVAKEPSTVRYNKANIDSALDAARRLQAAQDLYVFPTTEGFQIGREVPPFGQHHYKVTPEGDAVLMQGEETIAEARAAKGAKITQIRAVKVAPAVAAPMAPQPVAALAPEPPLVVATPETPTITKVETELAPSKRQRKARVAPVVPAAIVEAQAARSARSIAADARRLHSKVVKPDAPQVEGWLKNKGRMDIRGVDTPPKGRGRPGFSLPKGKQLPPDQFPEVVAWPQGKVNIAQDLRTGRQRYTPRHGRPSVSPEEGFKVISTGSTPPSEQAFDMGVERVEVTPQDVTFKKRDLTFRRRRKF